MNSLVDTSANLVFDGSRIHISLPNDVAISFPIAGNWRFEKATPEQLAKYEMDDDGIHWPEIDEDLSFAGLMRGDWGQYVKKPIHPSCKNAIS